MEEEAEIAIVGSKGQIVIPQKLRKELAILPNTKLCVYRKDDKLVVVKLRVPPLGDFKEFFKEVDERNLGKKKPTEDIQSPLSRKRKGKKK